VKQGNTTSGWLRLIAWSILVTLVSAAASFGQDASPAQSASMDAAIHELQQQIKDLRAAVAEVHSEAAQYRAETAELRRQLQATQGELAAVTANAPPREETANVESGRSAEASAVADQVTPDEGATVPSLEKRVTALEDSSQLLNSKVDDQYQTKVQSASKYRVRFSGLALLNVFSNRGSTDNQSIPAWAVAPGTFDSKGDFGATLNQSEFGFEVFGPTLAGAKTSGNIQVDFSGGFANTANGTNLGLVRLRTASLRLEWNKTSLIAGQDNLFLSPLSPTSFASIAEPAFSYAGNLWGWIPQVRVEHRFDLSDDNQILLQAGVIDNVTGEPPYYAFQRSAQAGERSSQPAFGTRVAWSYNVFGHVMTMAAAGYYSRQNWVIDHHVDGWSGMADWNIPIGPRLSLSGEYYRGVSVGGLGGGIGRSVLYSDNNFGSTTQVRGLQSEGGWSQLKLRATSKLEFNAAYGVDSPFAEYLREFANGQNYLGPALSQNRSSLINFVYRPRSNLLFSTEYRHLKTYQLDAGAWTAEQVNLMMGILF
jgi:prefoldin subunit 5